MSIFAALKTYRSLTPEQKNLLNHKVLLGKRSSQGWLEFLDGVVLFDKQCDNARSFLTGLLIVGFIILFMGGFALFVILQIFALVPIVLGLLFLLLVALPLRLFFGKKDLPNNLRNFVAPVIAILREDMKKDALLSLNIDLRGGADAGKRKKTVKQPKDSLRGNIVKRTDYFYEDPWMEMSGKLLDNSRFSFASVDNLTQSKITKRNPRGKYKSKEKWKIRRLGQLTLKPDPTCYTVPGAVGVEQLAGKTQAAIKEKDRSKILVIRTLVKSSPDDPREEAASVRLFTDLMGEAYKRMRPAGPKQ